MLVAGGKRFTGEDASLADVSLSSRLLQNVNLLSWEEAIKDLISPSPLFNVSMVTSCWCVWQEHRQPFINQ